MVLQAYTVTYRCTFARGTNDRITELIYYVHDHGPEEAVMRTISWIPDKYKLIEDGRPLSRCAEMTNGSLPFFTGYDRFYTGHFRIDGYTHFTVFKSSDGWYMDGRNDDRVDGYVGPQTGPFASAWDAYISAVNYWHVERKCVERIRED